MCCIWEILSISNGFRFCRPTSWCWEMSWPSVHVFSRAASFRLGHPAWCRVGKRLPIRVPPRRTGVMATKARYIGQWEREWSSRVECRRGDVRLACGVCSERLDSHGGPDMIFYSFWRFVVPDDLRQFREDVISSADVIL